MAVTCYEDTEVQSSVFSEAFVLFTSHVESGVVNFNMETAMS